MRQSRARIRNERGPPPRPHAPVRVGDFHTMVVINDRLVAADGRIGLRRHGESGHRCCPLPESSQNPVGEEAGEKFPPEGGRLDEKRRGHTPWDSQRKQEKK